MYVFNETYDSAMNVPVPMRRWLIRRWNKQKASEQSESDQSQTDRPMTPQERRKMIQQAQRQEFTPLKPQADVLSARRNYKTT